MVLKLIILLLAVCGIVALQPLPMDIDTILEDVDMTDFYIHDALQVRCAGIGVEDVRMLILCGNEHKLVEAAKRGW